MLLPSVTSVVILLTFAITLKTLAVEFSASYEDALELRLQLLVDPTATRATYCEKLSARKHEKNLIMCWPQVQTVSDRPLALCEMDESSTAWRRTYQVDIRCSATIWQTVRMWSLPIAVTIG